MTLTLMNRCRHSASSCRASSSLSGFDDSRGRCLGDQNIEIGSQRHRCARCCEELVPLPQLCVRACMCVCARACLNGRMSQPGPAPGRPHTHTHTHTHTHAHTPTHPSASTHTYTHAHTYAHTPAPPPPHTHTHRQISLKSRPPRLALARVDALHVTRSLLPRDLPDHRDVLQNQTSNQSTNQIEW